MLIDFMNEEKNGFAHIRLSMMTPLGKENGEESMSSSEDSSESWGRRYGQVAPVGTREREEYLSFNNNCSRTSY